MRRQDGRCLGPSRRGRSCGTVPRNELGQNSAFFRVQSYRKAQLYGNVGNAGTLEKAQGELRTVRFFFVAFFSSRSDKVKLAPDATLFQTRLLGRVS